ncbi:GTPase HflX [Williamsia soli]|uniref:GTPase HflX n=1 Tax=Williamsia soli TaxID=364929 RepID=UPI001A9D8CC6|nr:GTPase HflX [Williamsia soli]
MTEDTNPQSGTPDITDELPAERTQHIPTTGELQLDERSSLQRVGGLSTELTDVTEVEYRQLRLERVVLVGVWTQGSTTAQADSSMAELAALAETAGSEVLEGLIQRRDKPDPATYIGSGKAHELREIVLATGADTVICDGELTPAQLTALEKVVKVKVIDRTALILDIFAQHATSREGKAQVALAQMEYMLPRLRGWGESMSRQAGGRAGSNGGVGLRGPGETKIETDRRRIRERTAKLRREIREMKTSRNTKRSKRKQAVAQSVTIVGYTNAGKSSLINRMTGSGVLVHNALFATLDPTTRRMTLEDGRELVITDTVGFVRHLPTQLVEAFRSTLEEVADADLLLHIVDGSDPIPTDQISAVRTVIEQVVSEEKATAPPEILVINKIDVADPLVLAQLRGLFPHAVFISTVTGEGIEELFTGIREAIARHDVHVSVRVPYSRGDLVSRIHAEGDVLTEQHGADGTAITATVPSGLARQLATLAMPEAAEQ